MLEWKRTMSKWLEATSLCANSKFNCESMINYIFEPTLACTTDYVATVNRSDMQPVASSDVDDVHSAAPSCHDQSLRPPGHPFLGALAHPLTLKNHTLPQGRSASRRGIGYALESNCVDKNLFCLFDSKTLCPAIDRLSTRLAESTGKTGLEVIDLTDLMAELSCDNLGAFKVGNDEIGCSSCLSLPTPVGFFKHHIARCRQTNFNRRNESAERKSPKDYRRIAYLMRRTQETSRSFSILQMYMNASDIRHGDMSVHNRVSSVYAMDLIVMTTNDHNEEMCAPFLQFSNCNISDSQSLSTQIVEKLFGVSKDCYVCYWPVRLGAIGTLDDRVRTADGFAHVGCYLRTCNQKFDAAVNPTERKDTSGEAQNRNGKPLRDLNTTRDSRTSSQTRKEREDIENRELDRQHVLEHAMTNQQLNEDVWGRCLAWGIPRRYEGIVLEQVSLAV